jgi:uncharacterized protein
VAAPDFSLILLPTLRCNADCDYCFEDKDGSRLSLDDLGILIGKVLDHLVARDIGGLQIHWQGGEVMTLSPTWFERAHALIDTAAQARGRTVTHALQTNMIGYRPAWNAVIAAMFDNRVSTSVDYPNLHRHRPGRDPADYDTLWLRNVQAARAAGIDIQAIAVANPATLALGAEPFYRHLVDTLGITSFQVNTPFPGGQSNAVKRALSLDNEALVRFFIELADLWLDRGLPVGVRVGPFDELLAYFSGQRAQLPCIWTDDCTNHILAIDARGRVAQCDCWVTSYPDYRFGDLFAATDLGELLAASAARERFRARPVALVQCDCITCDYLAICHGGCAVRAYTAHGTLFEKDPYCALYRALFGHMATAAARLARAAAVVPQTAMTADHNAGGPEAGTEADAAPASSRPR